MSTQNPSNIRYFLIVFFVALAVPLLFYIYAPNLFPVKPDGIPWAQGLNDTETSFPLSYFLFDAGAMLLVFTIVQFAIIVLGKFLGIDTKWVTIITIVSLLMGIVVKFSPLGDTVIWNIMFRFRLEKYDNDVNMYFSLLSAGFILAVSIVFGAITAFAAARLRLSKAA